MKKVIIYGIRNAKLRFKVINYLSDDFEVLGVSDSFLDKDILQKETYIKPCNIKLYEFDYVLILAEKEKTQKEIKNKFIRLSISEEKIIVPRLLLQENLNFIPDLKKEIIDKLKNNIAYNTTVMGLSYSLRGIDFDKILLKCLDFSWHGLDLYYNYKLLELLLSKKNAEDIENFFLVFPFYYLNYDMSKSLYQFSSGQIFACRGFQDWHNAKTVLDTNIKEYLICQEMFGEKFWKYKNWKKISGIYESAVSMDEVELPKIWKTLYQDTWEENKKILIDIFEMLKTKRIILIIPPILTEVIKPSDMKYFFDMKKCFMNFFRGGGTIEIQS